ncbi:MAG: 3'-5' exoribonuclease YhaM family protein [Terriglobales bacterium]
MAQPAEEIKTSFVSELTPNASVNSAFLVLAKEIKQKKDGEPYLDLLLGDRTGQIKAVMWDRVAEIQAEFAQDDFIRVRGQVQEFRDKPQLKIDRLRRVEEADIRLADYLPATSQDVEAMWRELQGRIAAMTNPHLQALLRAIFDDPAIAERYRRAPAAKVLHHAYLGGLLEHVTSLARLAELVVRNYTYVDRDLLIAGILLHDLGKIEELNYRRSFSYTTAGQLLGHMVLVLEIMHKKLAELPGFPRPLQTLLEHLIISHHGQYEFGSPKLPMFPEALLLHQLDDMDSKMQAMRTQLEQEAAAATEWTGYNRSLERPLLKVRQWTDAASAAETEAAGTERP